MYENKDKNVSLKLKQIIKKTLLIPYSNLVVAAETTHSYHLPLQQLVTVI